MLKQTIFLATTALESCWDTTKPILFLGEWCKRFERKKYWETLDTTLLKDPALQHSQSQETYLYTLQVYEQLLPHLATWLNHIHQEQRSLQYWRIIVGPFLLWYIQVVYDRWLHLNIACSTPMHLETIGLSQNAYRTPVDMMEFYNFATESDTWNLQLFTQLLNLMNKIPIRYQSVEWTDTPKEIKTFQTYKIATRLKIRLLSFFSRCNRSRGIGLYACGFSQHSIKKLFKLSRGRIFPIEKIQTHPIAYAGQRNDQLRAELATLPATDELTQFVLNTLAVNMPFNYVEHYRAACKKSHTYFPYRAGVIVAAGWNVDDALKFWGAAEVERGAKIIDRQHGGGYGMYCYSTREFLERENCSAFISWGWSDHQKVIPAPAISLCEMKDRPPLTSIKQSVLWVINEIPRYLVCIEQSLQDFSKNEIHAKKRFAETLAENTRAEIIVRPRPLSKRIDEWRTLLPGLKVEAPEKDSFFSALQSAKIFVCDHLQTTMLYALGLNIPTVLFCDNTLPLLHPQTAIEIEKLQRVGIYHDSPESAAHWLNAIIHDPLSWWRREAVQAARQQFCDRFARSTPQWLSEWHQLLQQLKKKKKYD